MQPATSHNVSKFSENLDSALEIIQGVISELHMDGFCSIEGTAVAIARGILSNFSLEKMMASMAKIHEHWPKVKQRSVSFVVDDLTEIVKKSDNHFDVSILSIPLVCHASIKSSDKWKGIDQLEWPVNDEDVELVWMKFDQMIVNVCDWILEERLSKSDYYSEIDCEKYKNLFSTPLTLTSI